MAGDPKALTPGLHPILYHNDHDWTGKAPRVELLQGTGALATLASGSAFLLLSALGRSRSPTWRAFCFWMAFEGFYQSLSQLLLGAIMPGNDVGRALTYLHFGVALRGIALAVAVVAMATVGATLAQTQPLGESDAAQARARRRAVDTTAIVLLAVPLIVPFRAPRDLVEVLIVPLFVQGLGLAWLVLGQALFGRGGREVSRRPAVAGPAVALGVTLLVFQLLLRPGVAF